MYDQYVKVIQFTKIICGSMPDPFHKIYTDPQGPTTMWLQTTEISVRLFREFNIEYYSS